jgi:hypothetical protein
MTICGYNTRMGRGLLELFEGMYDAISDKADLEGSDVLAILRRELVEIPQVNAGLSRGSGTSLRMFEGLNGMALPLFRELAEDRTYDGSRAAFMRLAQRFIETLEAVEGYSENLPQPADGSRDAVAERASKIGKWAAENFSLQPA